MQHKNDEESAAINIAQAYGTDSNWLPYCSAGVVTKHPSGFQSCPTCGVLGSNCSWDNTVTIPTHAPDKPSESFPNAHFPVVHTAKYALGLTCGVCKHPCNETAGSQWYQLTKWKSCHEECWIGTCACYHESLNGRDGALGSFITFLEE